MQNIQDCADPELRSDVPDAFAAQSQTTHYVAVKLVPIAGGSIDNCDALEAEVMRQGGSVFWLLALSLIGLIQYTLLFKVDTSKMPSLLLKQKILLLLQSFIQIQRPIF